MSFGQVLSREMASKPTAAEPARANNAQPNNTQASRNEAKSGTAKSAEESTAASTNHSSAAADNARTAQADKAGASPDDADQDSETTVSAASAELLALVASLTKPVTDRAEEAELTDIDAQHADKKMAGQAIDPSLLSQGNGLPQSPATAATDPTLADAAIAAAAGRDIASRASTARLLNNRTEGEADGDIAAESGEFDAGLGQAADNKLATENSAAKVPSGRAEFAAQLAATETPAAKTMQDVQQAASPINISSLSQTQLQAQAAPAQQLADHLAPRVGSQGWDQALGQKVVWMVGGDQQSASLTLNPPDLGPLQVVLNVSNSQATANFTAAQPEVRQALENAMPKLREMLGEAGIQLSQANVSAGTPNNQQNAFEQPQQSSRQSAHSQESSDTPMRVVRTQTITGGQGLVDTFA